MQDLSYNFRNAVFDIGFLEFEIQVFTFENIYGLNQEKCTIERKGSIYEILCDGLIWAGGQEKADGNVKISADIAENKMVIAIDASMNKSIRCVKLLLKKMPMGVIVNLRETPEKEIPREGLIYKYPEGWRHISTPLIILKEGNGRLTYFRSLDTKVREKRFALIPRGNMLNVELIFEENSPEICNSISVPQWEIGTCNSIEEIYELHMEHIEKSYGLVSWDKREDIPGWAREISLVASIHCQHWTGYIFNNYDMVFENIRWIAERIEPKRVLAYLPGWEGRYYWKYGDYRPDERMGGEQGFKNLVDEAKKIGVHIMPMFGINIVNKSIENYEQWGSPSEFISAGGFKYGGSVDWDSSRHYDHGYSGNLNPAAPMWQNRLVSQIKSLIDKYGFDGVFLDISALWVNDPNHYLYDGILRLVRRIRDGRPDILVAGEGWYDAIGAAIPLVQSGHTDGVLHWHDVPYPRIFDKYNRSFGHLCQGDVSRGSTGVHELGYNPVTRIPVRKGIIPTVTIVEDTIRKAPGKILEIIEDAKEYAKKYI
ncbi:MAG: DUF6259 domain-containing protein [Bacillota bacterium]